MWNGGRNQGGRNCPGGRSSSFLLLHHLQHPFHYSHLHPHPLSSIVIVNHYYYYYDIEIFSSFSLSPVRRVRVALFYVNRSVRLTDLLYRLTFVGLWLYHALKWSVTQVFYFLGVIKVLKFNIIWFVVSLVGARGESKYRRGGEIVGEFFFSLSITGVE